MASAGLHLSSSNDRWGSLSPASPSPTASSRSCSDTIVVVPSPTSPTSHKCNYCSSHWDRIVEGLPDPEENPGVALHGWPELAQLITKHPDLEAFDPFRELHIKSLLYYQAELDGLRKSLHDAEWEDHRHGDFEQAKDIGKRVDRLLDCEYNTTNPEGRHQLELINKIRQVLKAYSEALLLYKQITALPQADKLNVNSLRVWLRNVHGDNVPIEGPGRDTWGKPTQSQSPPPSLARHFLQLLLSIFWAKKVQEDKENDLDLVVPRNDHKVDGFTQWVASEGVPFWENVRERWKNKKRKDRGRNLPTTEKGPEESSPPKGKEKSEIEPTMTKYSEHSILQFTSAVATLLACLLPTAAIAVLSNMHTTGKLLGLIAAFTTAFALGLMMLTDAGTSRVQIFTATAAFSAVLVVFVQNQGQK